MPSTAALTNKVVLFKVGNSTPSSGTVIANEDHGMWIQFAGNVRMEGVNVDSMKFPVIFVPYGQLQWLITDRDPAELSP